MKFRDNDDKILFLLEIDRSDLIGKVKKSGADEFQVEESMIVELLKKRSHFMNRMKDVKKSSDSKKSWNQNRRKIMKGIKDYNKSSEGKKFHRTLARFVASRDSFKGDRIDNTMGSSRRSNLKDRKDENFKILTALSSLKTNCYLQTCYYRPVDEEIDFELFMDELVEKVSSVEKSIYEGHPITEEQADWLLSLLEPKAIVYAVCERTKLDEQKVAKKLDELAGGISYAKINQIIKSQ